MAFVLISLDLFVRVNFLRW